jgi:hypothetical protein
MGETFMNTVIQRAIARPVLALLVLVAIVAGGSTALAYVATGSDAGSSTFPHSSAMEQQLGVRFSRLAVVGGGGLLEVSFVVLDVDKATAFETGLGKPPAIRSEDRSGGTTRISVMKQGHNLIAGQTYYLVYENTRGAVQPGGHAAIVDGRLRLSHIPVLG